MTHWNYRILQYADGSYGIHETYYNAAGNVDGWTKEPIIVSDTILGLRKLLTRMDEDIIRFPEILPYDKHSK